NKKTVDALPKVVAKPPRILLIDIETSPILAYVWGLYDQNISLNQIETDWEILCACYKWLGEEEIHCLSSHYMYAGEKKSLGQSLTHADLVEELWKLLDEADVAVAHNLVRFDNKKIKAKLKEYGLP